jgi:hypothetical protein
MFALPRHAAFACAALLTSTFSFAQSDAPPVCVHGGPYFAECNGAATNVAVDGSGSFDPEHTSLTFFWFEECPFGFFTDPTDPQTDYVIDMTGVCTRACMFALRVTSGGQMTACTSTVQVDDTTPPTLIVPGDVNDVWGIDTTPLGTGIATAVDLCDPAPVVGYYDTIIPQQGPGLEQTIIRTWQSVDYCNHLVEEQQVIKLLSPAVNAHNLEVDVQNCVDVIDRTALPPRFFLTVLGRYGSPVSSLNPATLRLSTMADSTHSVAPTQWFAPQDVCFFAATAFGECNPPGQDGLTDLRLRFDIQQVMTTLGLDTVAPGTLVRIMVTGQRWNGTSYLAAGELTVQ